MRLAFLQHSAVVENHTDVAGERARIRIVGIDNVAHLTSQCEHGRFFHGGIGERLETDIAVTNAVAMQ